MKLHILSALLFASATAFAQEPTPAFKPGPQDAPEKGNTYEIMAKGGVHSTWLFNKNISNEGDNMDYVNAWSFNYGLGFSAYFGNVGFGLDFLMGNHKAGYKGSVTMYDSVSQVQVPLYDYTSYVNLKTMQIPVMFKYKAPKGFYLEVGPQINLVTAADYHGEFTSPLFNTTVDSSKAEYYSSNYISGVVGLGYQAKFGDSGLSMQVGARLQYGFTDLKGVDGYGNDLNNKFYYTKKAATNAVSGGIMLALVYKLNK